jgi:hypothetical protein
MSAISAISAVSSAAIPNAATNEVATAKMTNDLGVIGSKLDSGNLSAAQSALSTFQQNVQGNPPFGMNSRANIDYQNLTSALQSGDLSAAQTALARLQSALQPEQASTQTGQGGQQYNGAEEGAAASPNDGSTNNSATTSTSTMWANTLASAAASSAVNDEFENEGSLLDMVV